MIKINKKINGDIYSFLDSKSLNKKLRRISNLCEKKINTIDNGAQSVALVTLLSHFDIDMYLIGLASLLTKLELIPKLVVLNDGTLNENDLKRLKSIKQKISIINNRSSTEFIKKNFIKSKLIIDHINLSKLNKKIIDLFLVKKKFKTEKVIIMDSDMVFFRKPKEIYSFIKNSKKMYYLQDYQNSYITDLKIIEKIFKVNIQKKFNSGLLTIDLNNISIEEVEKYYSIIEQNKDRFDFNYEFIEQTIFNILFSKSKNKQKLSKKYYIGFSKKISQKTICRHYVRPTRFMYGNLLYSTNSFV